MTVCGLGTEIMVGTLFLQYGTSEKLNHAWRVAQFMFPLLAVVTLQGRPPDFLKFETLKSLEKTSFIFDLLAVLAD